MLNSSMRILSALPEQQTFTPTTDGYQWLVTQFQTVDFSFLFVFVKSTYNKDPKALEYSNSIHVERE